MKHATLFELRVTHSFYMDGRCPDLSIEPSVETARLLRNHRCLMRSMPDGVRVVTALDGATEQPLVPMPLGVVLRFHLALSHDDFALFTDLTGLNAQLIEVAERLERAPLFTNANMAAGAAGDLQLVSGTVPCALGVFADVEIRLDGHGLGEQAPVFRVPFQARQWRWAYYCVTNLQPNGDALTVADKASPAAGEVLAFGAGEPAPLSDPIAAQIATRYPGMRCVRIMSAETVACREQPRKDLELHQVDVLGSVRLSGPLPNPSVRHVARLNDTQDVLFQIVKYRSEPF